MKVTIKEIAEMAGVHPATVDKVLHNRIGVSDDVRQRIRRIIQEVGYRPNPAGRVLQRQGKQYRIAAILVDVDAQPFLRQGIENGVSKQVGFDISIEYHFSSFQDAQKQREMIDQAVANKVDGIILSPINAGRVKAAIDRAAAAGIPVITTNSDVDGTKRACYVGQDGLRASRIAGRIMGQLLGGQGELAIVSSSVEVENNSYYVSVREQGFSDFMKAHYPAITIVECIESFEDPRITYEKTKELLRQHPGLRGLYITCGGVSEVGRALQESGRHRTVHTVSYEDYPLILELIRHDVIDCTLASELERQGELPVQLLMNYLVFGQKPEQDKIFTDVKILVKESLF